MTLFIYERSVEIMLRVPLVIKYVNEESKRLVLPDKEQPRLGICVPSQQLP